MNKKAPRGIAARPAAAAPAFNEADPSAWIAGSSPAPAAATSPGTPQPAADREPMKRLTFDVPASLHRRIKVECALKGVDMAAELRRIITEHFPDDSGTGAR